MKHLLYPRFRLDSVEYAEARRFWEELCQRAVKPSDSTDAWSPWLTDTYLNGARFNDGNPIFSLMSKRQNKGLSIIQIEPRKEQESILPEIRTFGAGTDEEIPFLEIECVLSSKTAKVAERLIRKWSSKHISSHGMREWLDKEFSNRG
jgi:hypothetical protein